MTKRPTGNEPDLILAQLIYELQVTQRRHKAKPNPVHAARIETLRAQIAGRAAAKGE